MLLAILVLSAVMAISFSIATITFIEIRVSGDLIRTEPAFYGAGAISEEALFNIKREVPSGQAYYDATVGNVAVITSSPSLNYPIVQVTVPPNSTFLNTISHYPIYDVDNPAPTGPGGLNPTGGSFYGKIRVSYLNTGNQSSEKLQVYLCQFDPKKTVDETGSDLNAYNSTPCTNPNNPGTGQPSYWLTSPNPYLLSPTETAEWGSPQNFNSLMQQELILVNPTSKYIYLQLRSYAPDGATPKGLPFFGKKAVDVDASNGGINRKIRVVIPNSAGSSGVADSNVALGKVASQSSTYTFSPSPVAGLAVDGNTNGDFFAGSVTHTNLDTNAWWQVDLGAPKTINTITIWNRTDGTAATWQRLQDFWIFISNTDLGAADITTIMADPTVTKIHDQEGTYPNPSRSYSVGTNGRYVRVELNGANYLHMAEVQVMGPGSGGSPVVQNVAWTNTVGVNAVGNNLTKTAASGWGNAGAFSSQSIPSGNGYVEFSTSENDHGKINGLSNVDADQNYTSVDFGLNTTFTGFVAIYEKGVLVANNVSTYVAGDIFRVAVESGVVKYYQNGTLLYTSLAAPVYPLHFDSALNLSGGTVTNAKIAY